ncbi:hypothetical protein M0L20_24415 [Spirosoma sp. RP8]|uniref:Uncharacterized protein n=1 Tax=Spirosoma liriopis TaxID=2937440 RepID=A0ABT0HTR9_9BACT|nr:hypothetical protein [Spirosoma liriopis]MCK8495038.1 hypothetical protein [Spirosoma liriopis]
MSIIKKIVETIKDDVEALQGNQTKDKRYQSEATYPDETTARQAFTQAREKLLAVNSWSNLPGISATFTVYDQRGNRIDNNDSLVVGHFILIELPGPLPHNWVRVVAITNDDTAAEFTVVPSESPQHHEESTAPIEHFFTDEASSTFRVERQGTRLIACEIGQNERVNNAEETAGKRSVVNTLLAAGGWAMFQETQWKKLTDYLVEP